MFAVAAMAVAAKGTAVVKARVVVAEGAEVEVPPAAPVVAAARLLLVAAKRGQMCGLWLDRRHGALLSPQALSTLQCLLCIASRLRRIHRPQNPSTMR